MSAAHRRLIGASGFGVVEVLIALVVVGIALTGAASALGVGQFALNVSETGRVSNNLAQQCMEIVQNAAYNTSGATYPNCSGLGNGRYAILAPAVATYAPDLQSISVAVQRDGKTVFTLQGLKVCRDTSLCP